MIDLSNAFVEAHVEGYWDLAKCISYIVKDNQTSQQLALARISLYEFHFKSISELMVVGGLTQRTARRQG